MARILVSIACHEVLEAKGLVHLAFANKKCIAMGDMRERAQEKGGGRRGERRKRREYKQRSEERGSKKVKVK